MSPIERDQLTRLEPELRGARRGVRLQRRTLSPSLVRTMIALRLYVFVTVAVIVIMVVRGVH